MINQETDTEGHDSTLYVVPMEYCPEGDETTQEFMEGWDQLYGNIPETVTPVMVYKYELDAVVVKLTDIQRQNRLLVSIIVLIVALISASAYVIYNKITMKMKKDKIIKRLLSQQAATLPVFTDKVNKLSGKSIKFSSSLYDEFQEAIDMVKGARKSGIVDIVNDSEFISSYPYIKELGFLTPQEKLVLILNEENFSTAEIALHLGISDNSVRAIKTRIRNKLAQAGDTVRVKRKFKIIKCILLLCTLLAGSYLPAQNRNYTFDAKRLEQNDASDYVPLALIAQKPKFKKSDTQMQEFTHYVFSQLKYPKRCIAEGIQGRVMLSFTITKEGDVTGVRILRGLDSELDAEAVRVVSSSPRWETPGLDKSGRAVSTSVVFPVIFQLKHNTPGNVAGKIDGIVDGVYPYSLGVLTKLPKFGGEGYYNSFLKWIYLNIKYPQECLDKNTGGRVLIKYIIDEKGNLVQPKIVTSSGNEFLDKEALRVLSESPKWEPGEKDGKKVKVMTTVPIVFQPLKVNLYGQNRPSVTSVKGNIIPARFTEGTASMFYTPGTYNNFQNWVFNNVKYPEEAREKKLEGRVYVSFVVDEKGKVTNVTVVEGCHKVLDQEAVRVISSSPDWLPATMNGVSVPTTHTFPLIFQFR
ncbi:MAG: TonB family protein [Bacteroidales bacterium]|nr:TonB family protein [Bacteroidales bacterium]